jgi:hypothetical protein
MVKSTAMLDGPMAAATGVMAPTNGLMAAIGVQLCSSPTLHITNRSRPLRSRIREAARSWLAGRTLKVPL